MWVSIRLEFQCGVAFGKTYDDWYSLLDPGYPGQAFDRSSFQALMNTTTRDELIFYEGQWELDYGTRKLEHYPEDDLMALSRPHDGRFDGCKSKTFDMWYLCYRKGALKESL
jgi:hypothetical protein